ncbi:MAG: homoserine dehydrogenase [Sedimentisphaerales bacterium]|nr:homoserine dehydrogenase [Sedimentisphaerales bacterium]
MENNKVKIAIIGFGTVGSGVAKIILESRGNIAQRTGVDLELAHVVDLDLARERPVNLPAGMLHDDFDKVLADSEVSIGVELIGGTETAAVIQEKLLKAGKDVVSANKALLAEKGEEIIYKTAREQGRCVAFEASCCGGIPIIGAIQSGLRANSISAMYGIVNGTCNYILSEMIHKGKEYRIALKEAQAAGYAEADPTLDVDGTDSAHKLAILAMLAYGKKIDFDSILIEGIDQVQLADILYGKEMGYVMKLLAIAEQTDEGLSLRVQPSFINQEEPLAKVSGPFNAVSIFGDAVGHTSYYGRGAGMMPTASAVVADIIEVARGNARRIFEATPGLGRPVEAACLCPDDEITSRFYLRLSVIDQPGVFGRIADILGQNQISILACLQHESESSDNVPVVFMTHKARQGDINKALESIVRLDVVKDKPVCIHVVTPPKG